MKTLQVNKELKQMCDSDFQCHCVNNDKNVTLNDKTSNDALYLRDGIHLNSMGSEKVVDNLELRNLAFVQNQLPEYPTPIMDIFHSQQTGKICIIMTDLLQPLKIQ